MGHRTDSWGSTSGPFWQLGAIEWAVRAMWLAQFASTVCRKTDKNSCVLTNDRLGVAQSQRLLGHILLSTCPIVLSAPSPRPSLAEVAVRERGLSARNYE